MAKYILVYELKGYPEDGGGTYTQDFGAEKGMHEKVSELIKEHHNCITIIYAGFLQFEFKYEAIEFVTKVKPIRV